MGLDIFFLVLYHWEYGWSHHNPESVILQSLEVRLIFPEERARWNDLMRQHHYIGFHSLIGESLRYLAVYQTYWLALIGWAAPALKCKVRDQWIGWPETIKNIRLPLIANNARTYEM